MTGSSNNENERANVGMRNQFYGTMQSILSGIEIKEAPENIKQLHAEATKILRAPEHEWSWNKAYRAEKILAHLRPVASLRYELETQIAFLEEMGHERWKAYRKRFDELFPDPPQEVEEVRPEPQQRTDEESVGGAAGKDTASGGGNDTVSGARNDTVSADGNDTVSGEGEADK